MKRCMPLLKLLCSLLTISLISLSCQKNAHIDPLVFDIDQATKTIDFDVNNLFKSGEMIRLENKPEALIGRITELEISDNYIVLYNQNEYIMLFNRQGEFLRYIGRKGKGPYEYLNVNGLAFSEDQDLILADRAFENDFIGYSIDGLGLFQVERANKGSHLFELLETKTILSIGYHNVPWKVGITDSINMYHIDSDGLVAYSQSQLKQSHEIEVGGIRIPQVCYPFNESFRIHFGQDTLFSYDPVSHDLETLAVFTSSSRGFDYHVINKKIENGTIKVDDHLGNVFVEVHAETKDYYLLHGVGIESFVDEFEGKKYEGIAPKSYGYFIVDKKSKSIDAVRLIDPFWGINLQKDAYAIPFNKLKFSNNRFAYFTYDAIDYKEDASVLVGEAENPDIKHKLANLDNDLSDDDNTILFIYELKK